MGKWTEAALKIKPYLMKGAQSLIDEDALKIKGIYPTWEELVASSLTVDIGYKLQHKGGLYKTAQPTYTFVDTYEPGAAGTESLFTKIDEAHAGTLEDPIPYSGNMELFRGMYYIQNDIIYLCNRDSEVAMHHALADLVGLYVEIVNV